jgi:hypothetical protein
VLCQAARDGFLLFPEMARLPVAIKMPDDVFSGDIRPGLKWYWIIYRDIYTSSMTVKKVQWICFIPINSASKLSVMAVLVSRTQGIVDMYICGLDDTF